MVDWRCLLCSGSEMEPNPSRQTRRGKLKWNPTKEMEMKFLLWMEWKGLVGFPCLLAARVMGCCGSQCSAKKRDKQSNKPKRQEYIEDYFLQLGAYSLAHNTVYNSNITQGVILLCTVDRLFQDFKIEGNELINFQNKFLERVEQFYHQLNK